MLAYRKHFNPFVVRCLVALKLVLLDLVFGDVDLRNMLSEHVEVVGATIGLRLRLKLRC